MKIFLLLSKDFDSKFARKEKESSFDLNFFKNEYLFIPFHKFIFKKFKKLNKKMLNEIKNEKKNI